MTKEDLKMIAMIRTEVYIGVLESILRDYATANNLLPNPLLWDSRQEYPAFVLGMIQDTKNGVVEELWPIVKMVMGDNINNYPWTVRTCCTLAVTGLLRLWNR